ncbi:uncharacterized protein LOC62_05G007099 [Vanrija pseudolonga]|uniref:Uncharacterized protein n=1 Tax=Vanrija pseudolonga TaxID=143232 RepID=A0AAF0YFE7_9TREE|nr:hypothetical protein LOC62_05G007099 [Vanrija pseudolonga]
MPHTSSLRRSDRVHRLSVIRTRLTPKLEERDESDQETTSEWSCRPSTSSSRQLGSPPLGCPASSPPSTGGESTSGASSRVSSIDLDTLPRRRVVFKLPSIQRDSEQDEAQPTSSPTTTAAATLVRDHSMSGVTGGSILRSAPAPLLTSTTLPKSQCNGALDALCIADALAPAATTPSMPGHTESRATDGPLLDTQTDTRDMLESRPPMEGATGAIAEPQAPSDPPTEMLLPWTATNSALNLA